MGPCAESCSARQAIMPASNKLNIESYNNRLKDEAALIISTTVKNCQLSAEFCF